MSESPQKCSIVVMTGDMDYVMAAFIIATTAAAMGRETSMFFTFWGVKAIQKGNLTSTQVRDSYNAAFGKSLNTTQWNTLVSTRLVPMKDRYLAMLAEVEL